MIYLSMQLARERGKSSDNISEKKKKKKTGQLLALVMILREEFL